MKFASIPLICLILYPMISQGKAPSKLFDLPKVVAVENRPYYSKHDLTFGAGWLPSDAFNKGFTAGTSYTYYFTDYLAWEVVNVNYVLNSETSLKSEMENLGITIENEAFGGALDYMTTYATTSLVYTPFYNKSLLFNETVVHGNTSLVLGAGAANFKSTGTRVLVSAGITLRFFTRPDRSWKFDFRNNVYFEDTLGSVYALSLGLGYSIELGSLPSTKK